MPTDRWWMALQARTLFVHDAAGRIVAVNELVPTPAPRLFLGRTRHGNLWRFRADLPDAATRRLGALLAEEPSTGDPDLDPVGLPSVLAQLGAEPDSVWRGPAWRFLDPLPPCPSRPGSEPARLLGAEEGALGAAHFPWLTVELADLLPCAAAIRDGQVVSLCFVARGSTEAAEAGVETAEPFRGRGLAPEVVVAWAAEVRRGGREPLYSTSRDNAASRRVAEKLGLIPYGSDLSIA